MRYMKSLLQTANYHSKITIILGDNALFLSTFLPSRRTMVSLLPSLLPCPVKFLFLNKKGTKNRIDQICSAPQPFFPYSISLTIRKSISKFQLLQIFNENGIAGQVRSHNWGIFIYRKWMKQRGFGEKT